MTQTPAAIDIRTVFRLDDEGPCAIYARGHVDTDAFIESARSAAHVTDFAEVDEFDREKVKHERWREVNAPGVDGGNLVGADRQLIRGEGPGSFPVTVLDFAEWQR